MNDSTEASAEPVRPLPIGHFSLVDERGVLGAEELADSVSRLAGGLRRMGLGPGVGAGIMCRNHRMFIQASRAALMVGADVYYLSTEYTARELSLITQQHNINLLVHDGEFAERARNLGVANLLVAWPGPDERSEISDLLASADRAPGNVPIGQQILFTSGTGGLPKAVVRRKMAPSDGVQAFVSRIPIGRGGTTLCAVPLYHVWGLVHLGLGLRLGTRLILPLAAEPYSLLQAIEDHRPDMIATTPSLLQSVVRVAQRRGTRVSKAALETLRGIAVAGSAMPPGLIKNTASLFGERLYSVYGSTEAGWISVAAPGDLHDHPQTAGRPLDGLSVRILDSAGEACRPGTVGRICVRAAIPSVTAPGDGSGLIDTGDLGYLNANGLLFVAGRGDEMLVVGGENVYPVEIEAALAEHPGVAEAAVASRPDPQYGEVPVAYVVPNGSPGNITDGELRNWLRDRLAFFKVPREICFVTVLPRNSAGKVLKRSLQESQITRSGGPVRDAD